MGGKRGETGVFFGLVFGVGILHWRFNRELTPEILTEWFVFEGVLFLPPKQNESFLLVGSMT